MTPERWEQLGRLLLAAREMSPADRADFLERECPNDPELKSELESLMASLDPAEAFLEESPGGHRQSVRVSRAGPYVLLEEIGRGGMGVVYRATRSDQGFDRPMALKLVKRGMDADFILRRFESERRILAGLDHVNIARVFDGGSTDDGLPYFVMELIEGQTLLDFCRDGNLGVSERLSLFRQVCSAVQYAHQRLVIHRDIKPSNILVTAEGVPKLLDFGLAKVLSQEPGDAVDRTQTALRLLTPEYASPEQIRGEPLTTASDVFSLGVVLYELLTGERPYRLKTRAPEEVSDAVLRQEPPRPSTKAGLHRDLDAIVLMALRKEPSRRYPSAEQLSEDIRRHLEGLPVKASPDSPGYRTGKFIQRHKLGVAAGGLAAASLLGGLGVSLWEMRVARSERNRAQAQAARAAETARFLGSIFQGANPVQARGKTVTARELLDRGAERIRSELAGQPEVEASLLVVMADAYYRLGASREAIALGEQALSIRERTLPSGSLLLAESQYQVGRLRRRQGQLAQALPLLEKASATREALLGLKHPDTLATVVARAQALIDLGRGSEAGKLLDGAIAAQDRNPPASAGLALLHNTMGILLYERGERAAARSAFEHSAAVYEKISGPDNWGLAIPLVNLGELLREDEQDLAAAESVFRRVLAIDEKILGKESAGVAYTLARIGDLKRAGGDIDAAREHLDRSLRMYSVVKPADDPELAAPLTYRGEVCLEQKKPEEARPLFERALAIRERVYGPEHPEVAETLVALARALDAAGQREAAEKSLRRALAIQRKTLVPNHRSYVATLTALGRCLLGQGRNAEARPLLAEAVQIARASLPERHSQRLAAEEALRAAAT